MWSSTAARGRATLAPMSLYSVDKLMSEVRRLAVEYRRTTGKTLPLTAELAVNDAVRLLELEPVEDPAVGYDAIRVRDGARERVLIKGRAIFAPERSGQRIGQLRRDGPWDRVILVIMDDGFEPVEIYEASREDIEDYLDGTSARQVRKGAMSVARFKIIAELVWDSVSGRIAPVRRS